VQIALKFNEQFLSDEQPFGKRGAAFLLATEDTESIEQGTNICVLGELCGELFSGRAVF
jgi:hypothetical protein